MTESEKTNLYKLVRSNNDDNIQLAKLICKGLNMSFGMVKYHSAKDACGVGPGDLLRVKAIMRNISFEEFGFINWQTIFLGGIEYVLITEVRFIDLLPTHIKLLPQQTQEGFIFNSSIRLLDVAMRLIIDKEHEEGLIITPDALFSEFFRAE